MFELGDFQSHSGLTLLWKINCDALTDEDIECLAKIVADKVSFSRVIGIPRGGLRLADALRPYASSGPILFVDDVLTTGESMLQAINRLENAGLCEPAVGVVIFARGPCPGWVKAIFSVDECFNAPAVRSCAEASSPAGTSPGSIDTAQKPTPSPTAAAPTR